MEYKAFGAILRSGQSSFSEAKIADKIKQRDRTVVVIEINSRGAALVCKYVVEFYPCTVAKSRAADLTVAEFAGGEHLRFRRKSQVDSRWGWFRLFDRLYF